MISVTGTMPVWLKGFSIFPTKTAPIQLLVSVRLQDSLPIQRTVMQWQSRLSFATLSELKIKVSISSLMEAITCDVGWMLILLFFWRSPAHVEVTTYFRNLSRHPPCRICWADKCTLCSNSNSFHDHHHSEFPSTSKLKSPRSRLHCLQRRLGSLSPCNQSQSLCASQVFWCQPSFLLVVHISRG